MYLKSVLYLLTSLLTIQLRAQSFSDSVFIRFSSLSTSVKDSVTLHAADGQYKIPAVSAKNPLLKGYHFISPAAQSFGGILHITAFAHSKEFSAGFTYPVMYRKSQPEIPKQENPNGIIDGVVLREEDERNFALDHGQLLDSVSKAHQRYRNQLQPEVAKLLAPFYFSKGEVTNKEYREFIQWVQDSVMRNMIYQKHPDDKKALQWLNISKKEAAQLDPSRRVENLAKYGLNFNVKPDFADSIIAAITKDLYYPQPERFYKRRTIDVSKLIYRKENGELLAVYPDTTVFLSSKDKSMEMMNVMYFWHPVYDEYPVLGVTYEQALAYCEWKQYTMNKTITRSGYRATVEIPSLLHYELAVKSTVKPSGKNHVRNVTNDGFHVYERNPEKHEGIIFLQPVQNTHFYNDEKSKENTYCENDLESRWKYNNWLRSNRSTPIYFLNGNVSELCATPVTTDLMNYYKVQSDQHPGQQALLLGSNYEQDVIHLEGNQKNAVFYKQSVSKSKTSAVQGFRTVVYLTPIPKQSRR